ncbi:MAG: hypothetical protein MK212_11205 [Saprospiraceae bacterium]|nr:hypothetical protein [Saprospiraceae bacterium]
MAKNVLKSESGGEKEEKKPVKKRLNKKRSPVWSNLNINTFYLFDNLHFIFYLAFLGIVYIANSHFAVNTIKEIKHIQRELEKISWESNSKKSVLMYESTQSKLIDKVHPLGLRKLKDRPYKIVVEE